MKTVAIGPEMNSPSWNWVGFDASRFLSKDYNILTFQKHEKIPECDCVFLVKHPTQARAFADKRKVVYCPIDHYQSMEDIREDRELLSSCGHIGVHCERLIPIMLQTNKKVSYVEHNGKYTLENPSEYKKDGFVLWVGGFQYIPYLLDFMNKKTASFELRILSDSSSQRAVSEAKLRSKNLGIKMNISEEKKTVNGFKFFDWSERNQFEMMSESRAAIDVKYVKHFSQKFKPPTKAQKYVSSSIPFATNRESYSFEYFSKRGFTLAEPHDTKRWFSERYWEETNNFAKNLRKKISIQSVGLSYKMMIDDCIHGGS